MVLWQNMCSGYKRTWEIKLLSAKFVYNSVYSHNRCFILLSIVILVTLFSCDRLFLRQRKVVCDCYCVIAQLQQWPVIEHTLRVNIASIILVEWRVLNVITNQWTNTVHIDFILSIRTPPTGWDCVAWFTTRVTCVYVNIVLPYLWHLGLLNGSFARHASASSAIVTECVFKVNDITGDQIKLIMKSLANNI